MTRVQQQQGQEQGRGGRGGGVGTVEITVGRECARSHGPFLHSDGQPQSLPSGALGWGDGWHDKAQHDKGG